MPKVDLNKAPYYDDFDENKSYHRILFRPSFAVQARELTQAQSILQNQVKRSADYFLQDGDYVVPGELIYDIHSRYVCIVKNQDVSDLSSVVGAIVGEADNGTDLGARGRILAISEPDVAANHPATLFVSMIRHGGVDGSEIDFREGRELFLWNEDGTKQIDTIGDFTVGTVGYGTVVNNGIPGVVGATSLATIREGIYYVSGHMVNVNEQTIILDKYSSTPSFKVGLNISYETVDEIDDSSLLDNATGAPNYLSPGAHRLKIDLILGKKTLYSQDVVDFIELLRVDQGNIRKRVDYQTSGAPVLQGNLAERTYDESGNYVVDPFNIEIREYSASLKDHLDRDGVTIPSQHLYETEEQRVELLRDYEDKIAIGFDPGKAYVKGYRVKTHSQNYIGVDKARDTKLLSGGGSAETKFADYGNYILVNNLNELGGGGDDSTAQRQWRTFNFADKNGTDITNAFPLVDLYSVEPYPSKVGTARLRDIQPAKVSDPLIFDSQGGGTDVESNYRVYLFDITTDSDWNKIGKLVIGQYVEKAITSVTLGTWTSGVTNVLNNSGLDEVEFSLSASSSADYNIDYDPDLSYNQDGVYGLKLKIKKNAGTWDDYEIIDGGQGFEVGNKFSLRVKIGESSYGSMDNVTVGDTDTNNLRQEINLQGTNASSALFDTSLNTLVYPLSKTNIREANGVSISHTRNTFEKSAQQIDGVNALELILQPNEQKFFQNATKETVLVFGYNISGALPSNYQYRVFTSDELESVTLSDNNRRMVIKSNSLSTDGVVYHVVVDVLKSGLANDSNRKSKTLEFNKQVIAPEQWIDNSFTLNKTDVLVENFKVFQYSGDTTQNYSNDTGKYALYTNGLLSGGALNDDSLLDITSKVSISSGQESDKYGFGTISITDVPDASVVIFYHSLDHTTGDYSTVQSYPFDANFYSEGDDDFASVNSIVFKYQNIPSLTDKSGTVTRLTDSIDFRPVVGDSVLSFSHLPTKANVSFNTLRYYQYRIDKIFMDTDGEFRVKRGIPADSEPPIPDDPREGMSLCIVKLSPYTYSTKDVEVTFLQNRRYTMKDISNLEKRVESLEYYSSLSVLEAMTNNLDLGENIFKNGFFVDGFIGHNIGDTKDSKYSCSIDSTKRELRPMFDMNNLNLSATDNNSSIRYMDVDSTVTDDKVNLRKTGVDNIGNIRTTGQEGSFITVPSNSNQHYGVLRLSPSSDDWKSLKSRPEIVSNSRGLFDSVADVDAEKSQFTVWNEWENNWSGLAIGNDFEKGQVIGNTDADELLTSSGSKTQTIEVLGKTVVTNYTPFIREQEVQFEAYGLLANSSHKIYIDDIEVASGITTDQTGSISGSFTIPNSDENSSSSVKFRTGTRKIRIEGQNSLATADFAAIGIVAEDWIDSIKIPEYVPSISKTGLYQEFKIGNPLFLRGVRLFMQNAVEDSEIYVEIRNSLGGKPGDRIIPFSEKKVVVGSGVSTSPVKLEGVDVYAVHGKNTDPLDEASTDGLYIEFDQPIYLPSSDYVLVISSNSVLNTVWINEKDVISPPIAMGGLSILETNTNGLVDSGQYICAEFYKYQFDVSSTTDIDFVSDTHESVTLTTNPLTTSDTKSTQMEVYYPNHGFEVGDYVKFSGLVGKKTYDIVLDNEDPNIVGETVTISSGNYFIISRASANNYKVVHIDPVAGSHPGLINNQSSFEFNSTVFTVTSNVASDFYFNGGVSADDFNHVDGHRVIAKDVDRFIITNSSFNFKLSGSGSTIEESIIITNPRHRVDVFNFLSQELTPSGIDSNTLKETNIDWQYRVGGSEGIWTSLDINSNVYLDDPVYLDSNKLELKARMSSPTANWTPMIDTERLSAVLVRNQINSVSTIKSSLIGDQIGESDIGKVRHVELIDGYEGSGYLENQEFIHSDSESHQIINITDDATSSPNSSGLKLFIPSGGVLGYEGSDDQNDFMTDDTGKIENVIINDPGFGYEQGDQLYLLKPNDTISDTDVARIDVIDVLNEDEYYLEKYGSSSYITKKVQLKNTANSITVLLNGLFPGDSEIKVYCSTQLSSQSSEIQYREVTYRSNINNVVDFNASSASGEYIKDIKYQLNQLPNFDLFNIKILFSSSSTTKVPKVKNLRVIAATEV